MCESQLLLKPERAAALLDLGKSKLYEMLRAGEIPSVRIGRAVRIPRVALEAWINERAATVTSSDGSREADRGRLRSD